VVFRKDHVAVTKELPGSFKLELACDGWSVRMQMLVCDEVRHHTGKTFSRQAQAE
jgi:hypothetical protein